ncbi:MAG: hypothetical protein PHY02_09285 [Phycisphaerae bacterium]|nr:hypothetical protein [Phycisphaerae bacterium]
MAYQNTNLRLFAAFAAAILIFTGCSARMKKPVRVCPGKESIADSLSVLHLQLENAVQFKAAGSCLLRYYAADKKTEKVNFTVKLWVNPPAEIYVQGDVAFDPKGIVFGSNEGQFWLAIKLKEISSYWWGACAGQGSFEKLMINPRLVLEALGLIAMQDEQGWSLSKEGAFDVLTKQQAGVKTRKIYVNNCDYLVRKIEYFDVTGRKVAVAELDKYKEISENFFVPRSVKITSPAAERAGDCISVSFNLESAKPADFTQKLRNLIFNRLKPEGFRHIYKIVNGKIIEQPQ